MPGHDGRDGEARFYCTTFESGLRTPRAKYGRHPDDGGGLVLVLPELGAEVHSHYGHYLPLLTLLAEDTRVAVVI